MKRVHIQSLEPKKCTASLDTSDRNIISLLGKDYLPENIYMSHESGPKIDKVHRNYFIGAYLYAYNNHYDVIFSVNDLWSIISLMVSKYINDNSEKLRSKIVNHEGQKKLVVVEHADSKEESVSLEKKWDYFFQQIYKQIRENTLDGVVDKLENNFSVANTFDKLFSTVTIMDSFKTYFTYGRMIEGCGIPNVHLEGTRDDWLLLKSKISALSEFSVKEDCRLDIYIDALKPIIDQFINTYDGKVDVLFWNTIISTNERRIGSGRQTETYMEGWISHFVQRYGKVSIDSLMNHKTDVPIELENNVTGETKKLNLIAGFTGITHDLVLDAYRPQMSIVLYSKYPLKDLLVCVTEVADKTRDGGHFAIVIEKKYIENFRRSLKWQVVDVNTTLNKGEVFITSHISKIHDDYNIIMVTNYGVEYAPVGSIEREKFDVYIKDARNAKNARNAKKNNYDHEMETIPEKNEKNV